MRGGALKTTPLIVVLFLVPITLWPSPPASSSRNRSCRGHWNSFSPGSASICSPASPRRFCSGVFFQNFLERGTGRAGLALVLGSLFFGASHLNNGPRPDWRYFVLATLAGLAYGWVDQRRRRLSAPAVTHTLVDVTWTAFC